MRMAKHAALQVFGFERAVATNSRLLHAKAALPHLLSSCQNGTAGARALTHERFI